MMQLHYRTGGEWRHDALECAQAIYDAIALSLKHDSQVQGFYYIDKVRAALDDDLDTHTVLHLLRDLTDQTLAQASSSVSEQSEDISPHNTQKPTQLQQIVDLLGLQF
jgi:cysteinyl-tRNA synthetase